MLDAGAFTDLRRGASSPPSSLHGGSCSPTAWTRPATHLWTAYDGETAGRRSCGSPSTGRTAYIYDIEVRDEQRRRGYGREVLDAGAVAARRARRDRTLGLNVFGPNDGARTLYERAGYATTERTYRIEL